MANEKEDLLPILIAALLPIFLGELAGAKTVDIWTASSEVEKFDCIDKPPAKAKAPGRLGKWLLEVSGMFSADQLDDYLADENRSFICDYKNALSDLPVRITLCTIDPAQQRSPIVYSNDAEVRSIKEGLDLHELYSEDCSPGGAIQVSNAIFGAKKYKRSLTNTDGQCRLRAMKPVFNSCGKHVYTLGVESTLFEDPVLQSSHTAVSEKPFQQVEDMLLVLPMLIRAPQSAQ